MHCNKALVGAGALVLTAACGDRATLSGNTVVAVTPVTPAPPLPPADPCAGLMPKMPAAQTASVPAWDMDPAYCGIPFGDGSGNIYLQRGYELSNSLGIWFGRDKLFMPLSSGLIAISQQMSAGGSVWVYSPRGARTAEVPILWWMAAAGVQANGGAVLVDANCTWNKNTVQVNRIDLNGQVTGPVDFAP